MEMLISFLVFILGGSISDFLDDPWPLLGSIIMIAGTLGLVFFGVSHLAALWQSVQMCGAI